MMYKEGVALKRKIVFPLFRTINVCGEKEEETDFQNKLYDMVGTRILCKPQCYQRSPLSHGVGKGECSPWLLFLTFSNPASGGSTVTQSYIVVHFLKQKNENSKWEAHHQWQENPQSARSTANCSTLVRLFTVKAILRAAWQSSGRCPGSSLLFHGWMIVFSQTLKHLLEENHKWCHRSGADVLTRGSLQPLPTHKQWGCALGGGGKVCLWVAMCGQSMVFPSSGQKLCQWVLPNVQTNEAFWGASHLTCYHYQV